MSMVVRVRFQFQKFERSTKTNEGSKTKNMDLFYRRINSLMMANDKTSLAAVFFTESNHENDLNEVVYFRSGDRTLQKNVHVKRDKK
jgi:hypothetical protein